MEYALGKDGRTIIARLDRGELMLESIREILAREGVKSGVVVSCIGSLDRATVHWITGTGMPAQDQTVTLEGPLELSAAQGIIADGDPHLHATISDTKKVYLGHLHDGCRVCYLMEICIMVLGDDLPLTRGIDPADGIDKLRPGKA